MTHRMRYALMIVLGLVAGVGTAVSQIRGGLGGDAVTNGAWSTGRGVGSADASLATRARVALNGLLALPSSEAIYFTAKVDDAGAPLDGRCSYLVKGAGIDARWWSITLYEGEGWLVKNAAQRYSFNAVSLGIDPAKRDQPWSFRVGPTGVAGQPWLPTGEAKAFDMTLRAYHPGPAMAKAPATTPLPSITKEGCA
jgi:hypothetical protein